MLIKSTNGVFGKIKIFYASYGPGVCEFWILQSLIWVIERWGRDFNDEETQGNEVITPVRGGSVCPIFWS